MRGAREPPMRSLTAASLGIPLEDLEHVTGLIAPCMSMWRGARILVTGASGFFGSWLVETFHHANKALGLGARLVGVGALTDDFVVRCPQLLGLDDVRMVNADTRQLGAGIRSQVPRWHDRIDAMIDAA